MTRSKTKYLVSLNNIRSLTEHKISAEFQERLDEEVRLLINKANFRCIGNRRSTLMAKDL